MRGRPFQKGHKTNVGRSCSDETRRKIGEAQIGKSKPKHTDEWRRQQSERMRAYHASGRRGNVFTPEVRAKMSQSRLRGIREGRIRAWNKGIPVTSELRQKLRESNLGQKRSDDVKRKIREALKIQWAKGIRKPGWKLSEQENRAKSARQRGSNSHLWRGGITPINQRIRGSFEYRQWREAVFRRDFYKCTQCGDARGGNLEADHIKPFAYFPELRFDISNGRTLCIPCHKKTRTWGRGATRLYGNRP